VLFALAVVGTSDCGRSTARGTAGVPPPGVFAGRVTAGPTCPVERVDHPCPPSPVVAEVQARIAGRVIARTRSHPDGSYQLRLPPGTYTVIALARGTTPRCAPVEVTIAASNTTSANISCDTGIR
jgi:hypothetical protein